jgi:hypothetical protein
MDNKTRTIIKCKDQLIDTDSYNLFLHLEIGGQERKYMLTTAMVIKALEYYMSEKMSEIAVINP